MRDLSPPRQHGGATRFPALAQNSIVFADNPSSLIQVTLAGSRMPNTSHDTVTFAMPAFYQLSNRDLAEALNFIRTGWGNHGSEVTVPILRECAVWSTTPPALCARHSGGCA